MDRLVGDVPPEHVEVVAVVELVRGVFGHGPRVAYPVSGNKGHGAEYPPGVQAGLAEGSGRAEQRGWIERQMAHGTDTRARRMQDIESDMGYDTRRRAPGGARARVSQTAVYDTCCYASWNSE